MNTPVKISLAIVMMVCLSGILMMNSAMGDGAVPALKPVAQPPSAATLYNRHAVDTGVSLLRSGYVVLRLGKGADSYMLAHMNAKDKSYSHCGIVVVEDGYPFVYHSIGGEDNPDERLRRDSASFFFSPAHNFGFGILSFDYAGEKVVDMEELAHQYYKEQPRFDMAFDLQTDDKLYCTEFVYKLISRALNDTGYIRPTRLLGHTYVGTDDLLLSSHAHLVWQTGFK